MDNKVKYIFGSVIIAFLLYVAYKLYIAKKVETAPSTIKTNQQMSDRLKEYGLVDKDASTLDTDFLKAWVAAAEKRIGETGGGLPGWEYMTKFYYRGNNYSLKGGSKV